MKRRAPDGFTLLELLIALSIVSMIVAALVSGLRLGTRAWESGRVSGSLDEAQTAARAIASQFERAFPTHIRRANGAPVVAFVGGPHSCRFVTLSEGEAQWGGLINTEIATEGGGRRANLQAWTQVFREEAFNQNREDMRLATLLTGVAFIRLSYFGATDPAQAPQWRDNWREAAILPRLVSVSIGLWRPEGVREASATVSLHQQ
jgi:general secretion pathway protein J